MKYLYKKVEDINFRQYGAHIFHTNNKQVWDYLNQYIYLIVSQVLQLPIIKANFTHFLLICTHSMKCGGVVTPQVAAEKIDEQRKEIKGKPKNLEEQAISLVGRDIYEKLVKGYTEKQRGERLQRSIGFYH